MHTTLRPGDYLYRLKNFVLHVGVYLGGGYVLHHLPGQGIIVSSISEFAEDKELTYKSNNLSITELHQERLIELLDSDIQYNPIFQNCEHTATYLVNGLRKSPQLSRTITGVAAGAALGSAFGKKGSLVGALLLGGLGFLSATDRSSHSQLRLESFASQ